VRIVAAAWVVAFQSGHYFKTTGKRQ